MQLEFAMFNTDNNMNLKSINYLIAGLLISLNLNCLASGPKKIGIQLYSLRAEFSKNVDKPISEIANTGYEYVEGYGYSIKNGFWGLSVSEYKDLLKKHKLKTPSAHYDFGEWEKTQDDAILQAYITVAKELKQDYIVVPYINPEIFKSEKSVKEFAAKLNRAAEIVNKAGLKLAYHNHHFEFEKLGDKTGYDILLAETNKDLIDFELDLYWVVRAKQDAISLFKQYPGRFPMWHIKDMSKSNPSKNTEIGNGTIDFSPFFKEAKLAGLKYAFVEQENFDIDPYESIKKSYDFLKAIK